MLPPENASAEPALSRSECDPVGGQRKAGDEQRCKQALPPGPPRRQGQQRTAKHPDQSRGHTRERLCGKRVDSAKHSIDTHGDPDQAHGRASDADCYSFAGREISSHIDSGPAPGRAHTSAAGEGLSPSVGMVLVRSCSRVRFAPKHQRQPCANDESDPAPPYGNDKAAQDNFPARQEPTQVNECHDHKDSNRDGSEWLHSGPPWLTGCRAESARRQAKNTR